MENTVKAPLRSMNNRLVLEVYKPGALVAKTNNGFASVSQAIQLKGLKVLVDAHLSDGTIIPAGSIAYVREKSLHTLPALKEILEDWI